MSRYTVILLAFFGLLSLSPARATQPPVSYGRDIRPILADKCFHCHGPDADARQADLRLDTREGLSGSVVVPGQPEASEMIRRVFSEAADEQMPPPAAKLTLVAEHKELLRRWVVEGAPFADHWSFEPLPERVPLPPVAETKWARQPFDTAVLARLETEKLQPAEPAGALRLLRRVSLDLTGLPPTPDECRTFEQVPPEKLDAAYEAAIDRLLASSAFGEHFATAWLDAARYADSYGYQSDQLNTQWPYRDWVIGALNDNLPYDKFLTWQLAGDLLPDATHDQILATAFNRLHRMTNEGGTIGEEARVEGVADRLQTFGAAMLGLTIDCSRCHDHKFDPITMRDYYALSAFFNSIDENGMYDNAAKVPAPSLLLPSGEQQTRLDTVRKSIADAEQAVAAATDSGYARFAEWLDSAKATEDADLTAYYAFDGDGDQLANEAPGGKGAGSAAGLQRAKGVHGEALKFDGDAGASFSEVFQVDRTNAFTLDFWLRDIAANEQPVVVLQRTFGTDVGYNGFDLMLERGLLEARFYRVWPGNAIGVRACSPIVSKEWQHVAVSYDGSSAAKGLKLYLAGQELPTEVLRDHLYKSASVAIFGEGKLTLGQRFRDRGFQDGEIDELRIYSRALPPLEIRNLHERDALATARADVARHRAELEAYYFSAIDPPARNATQQVQTARRELVALEDQLPEVPVMREMPAPRPTYILARGVYDAPKADANRVDRDTFAKFLPPFPGDAPRNRLGLAQWLTASHHPLTARVFVNRVWANFFGRGLVTTPDNLGQQGAQPVYQDVLDWLARDFIDHHWDIKRLCRQIALSATYRQDSRAAAELRARDPDNLLLARGPSQRLSGEQLRDLALAAAGLLDRGLGGPPVSPYQPGDDLWREANTMSPAYHQSTGKDLYRRSLYSVWKRTAPLPNMLAFDAPTREVCTVTRSRTNTPLQALVLLNDVQFVEAARALAALVAQHQPSLEGRIDEAFLRLAGRRPDKFEHARLTELYQQQQQLFADISQQDSGKFLKLGESQPQAKLPPGEHAALTVVCQAILNLDATIMNR